MAQTRRSQALYPINVRRLSVLRIDDVTPTLRRLTLGGDQLRAFTTADGIPVPALRNAGFDDHVKVIVPEPGETEVCPPRQVEGHLDWGGSSPAKDYTPRRYDAAAGELDLEFVRHGHGCAGTWVESVRPGDAVHIAGPKSSAGLPYDVDWLLVGGDETALPAIGRLLADLPDDARAQVFVEVGGPSDEVDFADLGRLAGVSLTWLHRGGAEAGTSDVLERALRAADWWPGQPYVWLAGEALTLKPLRAWLKHERQVPRDCYEVTGYWRRPSGAAGTTGTTGALAAEQVADDEDDLWDRLEALTDISGPVAIRAAVTAGLLEALEPAPRTATDLADALGLDAGVVGSLADLLATLGVLTRDGRTEGEDRYALAPLGQEIAEDDQLIAGLHLEGPGSLLEPTVPALVAALRSGDPDPDVAARLGREDGLAGRLRAFRGEDLAWPAPSVVVHHDWGGVRRVTVAGAGAPEATAVLLQEHPAIVATTVVDPSALAGMPSAEVDLLLGVCLLDQLPDHDAVEVLAGVSGPLLLAELVLDRDDLHDHDAALDLGLRVAFGSGVRTRERWLELFAGAGLIVEDDLDIGWDMRLWRLEAAPGR